MSFTTAVWNSWHIARRSTPENRFGPVAPFRHSQNSFRHGNLCDTALVNTAAPISPMRMLLAFAAVAAILIAVPAHAAGAPDVNQLQTAVRVSLAQVGGTAATPTLINPGPVCDIFA